MLAMRSEAWTVFACLNTGIMVSNPTQGMNVCLLLFCVCVWEKALRRADPRPSSPTDCLKLRNWRETKGFTNALCSEREQQAPAIHRLDACSSAASAGSAVRLEAASETWILL
jgi:hypothetical protein